MVQEANFTPTVVLPVAYKAARKVRGSIPHEKKHMKEKLTTYPL